MGSTEFNDLITNLIDRVVDRALNVSPFHSADLGSGVNGKLRHHLIPSSRRSLLSPLEGQLRNTPKFMFDRRDLQQRSKAESPKGSAGAATRGRSYSGSSSNVYVSRGMFRGQMSGSTRGVKLVMAGDQAVAPDVLRRRPYKEILFGQWFGEEDVYNLNQLTTLTAGKTTRLVKDQTTGNVLLGYKQERTVAITDPTSVTLEPGEEGKAVVVATVPSSSWSSVGEAGPIPGDIIMELSTSGQTLDCSASKVEAANDFLAKSSGPLEMKVVRERFIPAWMEPKVWQKPNELEQTYYLEQKYMIVQKAADNIYRSSAGLKASDVTVFEKGRKAESSGFGKFKSFFQTSDVKGEGSFGQVFDGVLKDGMSIVLKRPKMNVVGASEMLQLELLINEEVKKWVKPGVVAPFFGYIDVSEKEEGQIYDGYLSTGLWLVWEAVLARTLYASIVEAKGEALPGNLAQQMKVAGEDPTKLIMTRVFEALVALHEQGFVHRDIKPENILTVEGGQIRIIDLGSTASCLHKILSYEVGFGPRDPAYSAEADTVLLPEGTERPEKSNLPALWDRLQPYKFDIYSAGTLLLQLACPALRTREALVEFQSAIKAAEYDLDAYRRSSGLTCALLDADEGSGWELAARCLKLTRSERPTAQEALAHRFLAK